MANNFVGVKIALLYGEQLVISLRDDKPGLRFAGLWDFPGGGRDGNETPFECVAREVDEELSIKLKPDQIIWEREYPSMHDPHLRAYFMVAKVSRENIDGIRFGTEGQRWALVKIDDFLVCSDVVPHLKERFQDYLKTRG
jgi:8-oxo-dGTP diphosphatase